MCPSLTVDDVADMATVDSIDSTQFSSSKIARSDFSNIRFRKFGGVVSFSYGCAVAFKYFPHVVGLRSCMQMRWLYADRSIAPVQDKGFLFSDWIVNIVDAVRGYVGSYVCATKAESPVSMTIGVARPVPTPLGERWGQRRITSHIPSKNLCFGDTRGSELATRSKRISVSPQSIIVGSAQILGLHRQIAFRNFARQSLDALATTQGVAMSAPSLIVGTTPTSSVYGCAVASVDRAAGHPVQYSEVSV
jgi:hypothetical protein